MFTRRAKSINNTSEFFLRVKKREEPMTKADIVENIYEKLDMPKEEVTNLADLAFDIIKETLQHGENVMISGFGNFIVRNKGSRRGRNPKTGCEMELASRRVVRFRPSHALTARVNESICGSLVG